MFVIMVVLVLRYRANTQSAGAAVAGEVAMSPKSSASEQQQQSVYAAIPPSCVIKVFIVLFTSICWSLKLSLNLILFDHVTQERRIAKHVRLAIAVEHRRRQRALRSDADERKRVNLLNCWID